MGIIDQGITPHTDLNANLLNGYNFADNNTNTNDTVVGHGTRVAGVLGAVGNNNNQYGNGGITGVSWEVGLVPLKIDKGSNTIAVLQGQTIQAITYAINTGIGILNCSQALAFDYPNFTIDKFDPLYRAIGIYGGLFVQGAGNNGGSINPNSTTVTEWPFYAGLRQKTNVIIVGAIDSNGNISSFSNHGEGTVHLFAPGGNIYSTIPGNTYGYDSGTSYAVPHVAGVAHLLKSVNPFLTTAEIKTYILFSVTKQENLADYCSTGGRLNAQTAISLLGTIAGYMDIKFTNSNWGITGTIGRFYLFTNGKWIFVERGFKRTNQNTSWITYPFSNYLQMDPIPAGIANKLGNNSINTTVRVVVPATDTANGNHNAIIDVNFVITRNGVTISGGNTIVTGGSNTANSNIYLKLSINKELCSRKNA